MFATLHSRQTEKKNIEKEIMDTGERTAIDLGIYGVHIELTKLVGRMRYRASSY